MWEARGAGCVNDAPFRKEGVTQEYSRRAHGCQWARIETRASRRCRYLHGVLVEPLQPAEETLRQEFQRLQHILGL